MPSPNKPKAPYEAIELLEKWLEDESGYDEETWSKLQKELRDYCLYVRDNPVEMSYELIELTKLAKHLVSALDHCLRFSTLKRNYPGQYEAFVELIGEARRKLH